MRLLVSLCNLPEPGPSGLLVVDPAEPNSEDIRLLDIGATPGTVHGCLGLAATSEVIYCAWIGPGQASYLSVLARRTLAPLEVVPLQDISDVHSLCIEAESIYVVATGADEVRRLDARRIEARSEVVWRATPAGRDTHHVNSIVASRGQLLCSAFGPKSGDRWSTALAGYVVDIRSNEILWTGIEQPHSLVTGPDDLYIAESRRQRVVALRSGRHFPVDGYARGLAFTGPASFVAGVSQGRARSRLQGTIENPADPGDLGGACGLVIVSDGGENTAKSTVRIDLSAFGREIYDVAAVVG
jgi:hypothetical protein